MKRCPECKTKAKTSADYCRACFYHFKPEDTAQAMFESHRRKARFCSIAIGLGVAVFRYAFFS